MDTLENLLIELVTIYDYRYNYLLLLIAIIAMVSYIFHKMPIFVSLIINGLEVIILFMSHGMFARVYEWTGWYLTSSKYLSQMVINNYHFMFCFVLSVLLFMIQFGLSIFRLFKNFK